MQLMGTVGQAMQRLIMIQSQNKEQLEDLAVELVVKELGIPEGAMQFDAQLVMQPGGFEIEIKDKHLLPVARQMNRGIRDDQAPTSPALVGIKSDGLHKSC